MQIADTFPMSTKAERYVARGRKTTTEKQRQPFGPPASKYLLPLITIGNQTKKIS